MKRHLYPLAIILFSFIACTKKEVSNEIIKFSYDTPTYSVITKSYASTWVNTYFFTATNGISLQPPLNGGNTLIQSSASGSFKPFARFLHW